MYINTSIVFSNEIAELIWLPDPFFPLSKKGELHQLTKPNLLFELSPDGTIFFSQRSVYSCIKNLYISIDFFNFILFRYYTAFCIASLIEFTFYLLNYTIIFYSCRFLHWSEWLKRNIK